MTDHVLSIPEAAAALGCSKTHLYALIAAGELRAVNIALSGTRTKTRIRPDDLSDYIDRNTQAAVAS